MEKETVTKHDLIKLADLFNTYKRLTDTTIKSLFDFIEGLEERIEALEELKKVDK